MAIARTVDPGRRRFLATIPPACAAACAATCLWPRSTSAQQGANAASPHPTAGDIAHPFDAERSQSLTHRQLYRLRYREAIELAKLLEGELGRDRTAELLKNHTARTMAELGRRQAAATNDHSLRQYTEQFRDPDRYRNRLVMEIVEDSETAFELKVTECIWASTFHDADAADIGFAMVCHGDYAWAEGFDERIALIRDKTLMQGAAICNHRYVWQG